LLIDVAQSFESVLPRKTDFISRLGGDEFAVVLYDTDLQGSKLLAERLLEIARGVSVRSEFTNTPTKTPVSIGITHLIPTSEDTVESLLQEADEALYSAKEFGKDNTHYR